MTRWTLVTSTAFDRDARKLDKHDIRRIRRYLEEVCALEDPRSRGRGLTANRAGYWRYRIGDYRVIVEIIDADLILVGLGVGHRSGVYD